MPGRCCFLRVTQGLNKHTCTACGFANTGLSASDGANIVERVIDMLGHVNVNENVYN